MSNIVITVESGSDIPKELAEKYGIFIIPMYVQFGHESKADGSFLPAEVCRYFNQTGKVPKTSGSTPEDCRRVFDEIHRRLPEKKILHLAYSAATTCSYQSARIAAEGREYVACVDTRHVTVGQTAAVVETARQLEEREFWDLRDAVRTAEKVIGRVRMCFLPNKLTYLRAGGRCSNLTAICGSLLQIHPCIEVKDGFLRAAKKYRGSMQHIIPRFAAEFIARENLDRKEIWFLHTPDFPKELQESASKTAAANGFRTVHWMQAGGVITAHGGPCAFAIAGYASPLHQDS